MTRAYMPFLAWFLSLVVLAIAGCGSESEPDKPAPDDAGTQPPHDRLDASTDASEPDLDGALLEDGALREDARIPEPANDGATDTGVEPTPDAARHDDATVDPQPEDASVDPSPDATVDPLPDATVDPLPDATVDPLPDGSIDPLPDSGVVPLPDAGWDAAVDAGDEQGPDAAPDSGPIEPCPIYLHDADGDGYGDPGATRQTCSPAPDYVQLVDCDDADNAHWSDCSTCVDEDDDGYGFACNLGTDCDDGLVSAHPGATERAWNGLDDDCDGSLGTDLTRIGNIGGWARSVLLVEDTLIAGVGFELHFYDAFDLSAGPFLELPLPAPATQLELRGDELYASLAGRGLARFNVASLASPLLIDIYSHPRMRNFGGSGFELSGDRITLCDSESSYVQLTVANITPDGLRRHGFWAGIGGLRGGLHCDVVTMGDRIWAATDGGMLSFGLDTDGMIDTFQGDSWTVRWPQVVDGQSHVARGVTYYSPYNDILVHRTPVADDAPADTVFNGRSTGAIALADGRVFFHSFVGPSFDDCFTSLSLDSGASAPCVAMSSIPEDIRVADGSVYVAHGDGISRLGLDSATGAMTPEETFELFAHPIQLESQPPYLYVVDELRGVQILEVDGPSTLPRLVGALPLAGYAVVDLVVRDGIAYQREQTYSGFAIVTFDVSNPAAPVELDRYEVIPGHWSTNVALHLHGSTLFSSLGADLYAFDVSNPAEIREHAKPAWTTWIIEMTSHGDELIVLTDTGLDRYDAGLPEAPVLLDSLSLAATPGARHLAVSGGIAVVDDIIVDLESMTVLDVDLDHRTLVHSMRAFGARAYLTDVNGVRVIDFSNPEKIRRAELYRGRELIGVDIAISGGAFFIAGRDQGLTMLSSPDAALP